MKKYILFISVCAIIALIAHTDLSNEIKQPDSVPCSVNAQEVELYINSQMSNRNSYITSEYTIERQSVDGSRRKIYRDPVSNSVMIVEDIHSGESGYRTYSTYFKENRVISVVDLSVEYPVPPSVDPNSIPNTFYKTYYITGGRICSVQETGDNTKNEISENSIDSTENVIRLVAELELINF